MADYYPLIARAIANLPQNTDTARRALYERARTVLTAQLRSVNPPLNEPEIDRERRELDSAIRKAEEEAVLRSPEDPKRSLPQLSAEHADQKWGFSIRHSDAWSVVATEHTEGTWIKPVVLARTEQGERVAIFIISIGAMHKGGTIAEYMRKARHDLSNSFQEFTLITASERSVNSLPTAWIHYRYIERGKRNEEYNVTFFLGSEIGVPFQIVCFTDCDHFSQLKEEFTAMIQSLIFLRNRLWLPHISFYGASQNNCQVCGSRLRPGAAFPFIKFPENQIQAMCNACMEKLRAEPSTAKASPAGETDSRGAAMTKDQLPSKLFIPGARLPQGIVDIQIRDDKDRMVTLVWGSLEAASAWLKPTGLGLWKASRGSLPSDDIVIREAARDEVGMFWKLARTRVHFEPDIGSLFAPEERQISP